MFSRTDTYRQPVNNRRLGFSDSVYVANSPSKVTVPVVTPKVAFKSPSCHIQSEISMLPASFHNTVIVNSHFFSYFMCTRVCLQVCLCITCTLRPGKGTRPIRTRLRDGHKQTLVAENWTQDLCKASSALNHKAISPAPDTHFLGWIFPLTLLWKHSHGHAQRYVSGDSTVTHTDNEQ